MAQTAKTRKELEEETRRQHILNAAERLFAERGLIDTSVADIAKESEFGIGTLYKYFKDKNTLIQSLLDSRLTAHFDEMEEVLQKDDPPANIIEELIECQLDSLNKRRLFFIIYYTHFHPGTIDGYAGYTGALDHDLIHQRKREMMETMTRVFEKGIMLGQFVPMESRFLSAAVFGMFISFSFVRGRNTKPNESVEEMKTAMKRILFNGVLISKNDDTKEQDLESE